MTPQQFGISIGALTAGLNREFSAQQTAVWYDCLGDLDPAALGLAIKRWLCEVNSGFPSIATIRQFALEAERGQEDTAADAWARVLKAVHCIPSMDDEHLEKARAFVGEIAWRALGGTNGFINLGASGNTPVERGQFRVAYESLVERQTRLAALPADVRPRPALTNDVRRIVEQTTKRIGGVE